MLSKNSNAIFHRVHFIAYQVHRNEKEADAPPTRHLLPAHLCAPQTDWCIFLIQFYLARANSPFISALWLSANLGTFATICSLLRYIAHFNFIFLSYLNSSDVSKTCSNWQQLKPHLNAFGSWIVRPQNIRNNSLVTAA